MTPGGGRGSTSPAIVKTCAPGAARLHPRPAMDEVRITRPTPPPRAAATARRDPFDRRSDQRLRVLGLHHRKRARPCAGSHPRPSAASRQPASRVRSTLDRVEPLDRVGRMGGHRAAQGLGLGQASGQSRAMVARVQQAQHDMLGDVAGRAGDKDRGHGRSPSLARRGWPQGCPASSVTRAGDNSPAHHAPRPRGVSVE